LGQALAKRALQIGYTPNGAPALAAVFTEVGDFPKEVTQEFADAMTDLERIERVTASFPYSAERQAWARKVLDT
jgi:hypothetical protein